MSLSDSGWGGERQLLSLPPNPLAAISGANMFGSVEKPTMSIHLRMAVTSTREGLLKNRLSMGLSKKGKNFQKIVHKNGTL